jgi:Uma2 family endonuclease
LGEFYCLPVHIILDEHLNYEPDACFIAKPRLGDLDESVFEGAPDLVVEVLSPCNRDHDTKTKFRDYERYGVREYGLLDPEARWIEVWHLEAGEYRLLGRFGPGQRVVTRVLAGLDLDPARVF